MIQIVRDIEPGEEILVSLQKTKADGDGAPCEPSEDLGGEETVQAR